MAVVVGLAPVIRNEAHGAVRVDKIGVGIDEFCDAMRNAEDEHELGDGSLTVSQSVGMVAGYSYKDTVKPADKKR